MNQLILPVQPLQLPSGFCPKTFQDILDGFSAAQQVVFPSTFTGVVASQTKPVDTTQIWLQLDTQGRPVRLYTFAAGVWLSLHPDFTGKTIIWTGAVPDFTVFDGGDANAPGVYSGPMWQAVLPASFPLGAGTLPSGTVVAPGQTGGEEKHALALTEMPYHTHSVRQDTGNYGTATDKPLSSDATLPLTNIGFTGGNPGNNNATDPHNTMPPYTGVTFMQRTSRLFYTVT